MSEVKVILNEDPTASITPNVTPSTPEKKPKASPPPSPTSILDPNQPSQTTTDHHSNNVNINNEWEYNSSRMPSPTSGHTATCIDKDRIVIVGGLNHENRRLKSVDLFTTDDKYVPLFDMSIERSSHGAVYFDHQNIVHDVNRDTTMHNDTADDAEKENDVNEAQSTNNESNQGHKYLYVFGGLNINGKSLKSVERMNTKTYWWEKVTDMTQPRSRCATATCKDHIYVIGGYSKKSTYLSSMERYDPSNDSWEIMPPMTYKRIYHAAVTVGERIYVLGGGEDRSLSGILKSVEIFDTVSKSWSRGPDMPMKLSGMSAITKGKWILVIGGLNARGEAMSQALILNTETLKWYRIETPRMIEGRSTHAAVIRQSKIYIFGGQGDTNNYKLDSVEQIMLHDLMMVVLELHATNASRMKGLKRPLKLFESKGSKEKESDEEEDTISTGKESNESNNDSFDSSTYKSKDDSNDHSSEEDNQSRGLCSTNSSKSTSSKTNSKSFSTTNGIATNVLKKITNFGKKKNDPYQNFDDAFDENLSVFTDQLIDDDGSFCSSIAVSNHNSMIVTRKMEENFMSMKSEYVDLERKVIEQNKSIDQLLKHHRLSEMETLIVEQRKIIQDLVRREQRNTINDDLLICNGKIAKMEKLADGHRLIFNNFRRQQQRTNHINGFKIEEVEKTLKEHEEMVDKISLRQDEIDKGRKDDDKTEKEVILKLKKDVDSLVEQLQKEQVSHQDEIEQMKQQHEQRVTKLEKILVKMQKSYDQKFAKVLDAVDNLELVSNCLMKEVELLKIENQFLKDK